MVTIDIKNISTKQLLKMVLRGEGMTRSMDGSKEKAENKLYADLRASLTRQEIIPEWEGVSNKKWMEAAIEYLD